MPTALPDARRMLAGLLRAARPASPPRVVNLVGPLGIGKSRLLAEVAAAAPRRPWIFDGADSEPRIRAARRRLRAAPPGTVMVVAARRALASRPAWGGQAAILVELSPWPEGEIRALAAGLGLAGAAVDVVARLAGGVPLLAGVVAGALLAGADPGAPGALADAAAAVVLRRLRVEAPGLDLEPLPILSTVDGADEELLAALVRVPRGGFDGLARLSVVRAEAHGLGVVEPFRTVLDLAYRWRRPDQQRRLAARAAARRHGQVALTGDARLRARLAEQVLFLSARPHLRDDLFTEGPGPMRVRPAAADDASDMGRLTRQWSVTEGLDGGRADRMLQRWLDGAEHGFHLLVDGDDRAVGMVNLTPLDVGPAPVLDSLLQQHASAVVNAGGAVVGMMAVQERYARFQPLLVRQIMTQGIARGRLVVSTPWLPYQQMCARFGLRRLGQTRDDLYRCGRANAVWARAFRPAQLPGWLGRLQAPPPPAAEPPVDTVRATLEQVRARRGPAPVDDRVVAAVVALGGSASPVDREAAAVLSEYYLRGARGHDLVAYRLHLSRATYFRRLRQGLLRVAELLD
ncbi:hypothetical protein AB0H83_39980 [Dactylosporangium sp. NPDC050688]|uniref:hypothetical protein n=1 Tax=Dactylosporangium sp. NPDC050688 TaxID=3157217 RepID=UPI0033FB16E4